MLGLIFPGFVSILNSMRVLDPIHKYIYFSETEARLIDSAVFQRLRGIRQLGFSEWAFPGATHNRFLHSMGVCHLVSRAFDRLFQGQDLLTKDKKQSFRQLIRLAALLHDTGHGPFSHSSEQAMPPLSQLNLPLSFKQTFPPGAKARHEHFSIQFILHSVSSLIKALNIDPLCLAHLIDPRIPFKDGNFFVCKGVDFKPVLKQLISSDLDMDRMDYLRRDAYFCGVDYGFCDPEWILNNIQVYQKGGRAYLSVRSKAIYSVESFFLGRRHISMAVYFHNKMVAMEEMLFQYFKSPGCSFLLPSDAPSYISCTDNYLTETLKSQSSHNEWARRLVKLKPFKRVFEMGVPYQEGKTLSLPEKVESVLRFFKQKGIYAIHSHSLRHIKKLYHLPLDKEDFPIYVVDSFSGQALPLREKLKIFNQIHHIESTHRIYISPEEAQKINLREMA